VKTLNKCIRSSHFCSVIMHIWFSSVAEVFLITHMWWLHHKCELGGNSSTLHYWVGWFPRKLPVNFRHQTSYRSHVFIAVRIKSQFDIYFINIKQMNKIYIYEGYSESKYSLRISFAHPRDCPFAHVQWFPLSIEKPQTPFCEIRIMFMFVSVS